MATFTHGFRRRFQGSTSAQTADMKNTILDKSDTIRPKIIAGVFAQAFCSQKSFWETALNYAKSP